NYVYYFYYVLGTQGKLTECLENGRFYRNPDRPTHKMWTSEECSKYFLCLENEVFEFQCSTGLLFDVNRQICDFKPNVDNCDITAELAIPKPLLNEANCSEKNHLGCADGTCLPQDYFCDGSQDCPDASDEAHCDLTNDPNAAPPCNVSKCLLPDCFCSRDGTDIPGNLYPSQVPQMILVTFDDSINDDNWELYRKNVFPPELSNPNGCPLAATFFVSHQYNNNYYYTQKQWNSGYEIAVHSISHRGPKDWWSLNATIVDWFDEMAGQANILNRFAKIRAEDIRGMRVPFLSVGWNRQFLLMEEIGFVYDNSIVPPFSNPPLWPYTLDFKMPHSCKENNQVCPTRSYTGVWEIPLNQLEADNFTTCTTMASCIPNLSGRELYTILMHNFKRHYLSNRAPYGLHLNSKWFKNRERLASFHRFLKDVRKQPDVWLVTNWQAIQWMRKPKTLDQISSFEPWSCRKRFEKSEIACDIPNVCKLHNRILQQDRYLHTCIECPRSYPWIRNEFGVN
ncbi:hypothetical protein NQ317_007288, partial [Molorchus minor]